MANSKRNRRGRSVWLTADHIPMVKGKYFLLNFFIFVCTHIEFLHRYVEHAITNTILKHFDKNICNLIGHTFVLKVGMST